MSAAPYPNVASLDRAREGSTLSSRGGVAILLVLSLVQFMDILDASIPNIALPPIKNDLGFSQQSPQWVIDGYILAYGGFLLLGGRLADLLGRRLVLVSGLLVFAGSSLAGGLATARTGALLHAGHDTVAQAATHGYQRALVAGAAFVLAATVVTALAPSNRQSEPIVEEEPTLDLAV